MLLLQELMDRLLHLRELLRQVLLVLLRHRRMVRVRCRILTGRLLLRRIKIPMVPHLRIRIRTELLRLRNRLLLRIHMEAVVGGRLDRLLAHRILTEPHRRNNNHRLTLTEPRRSSNHHHKSRIHTVVVMVRLLLLVHLAKEGLRNRNNHTVTTRLELHRRIKVNQGVHQRLVVIRMEVNRQHRFSHSSSSTRIRGVRLRQDSLPNRPPLDPRKPTPTLVLWCRRISSQTPMHSLLPMGNPMVNPTDSRVRTDSPVRTDNSLHQDLTDSRLRGSMDSPRRMGNLRANLTDMVPRLLPQLRWIHFLYSKLSKPRNLLLHLRRRKLRRPWYRPVLLRPRRPTMTFGEPFRRPHRQLRQNLLR
mmetsp:Transcript_8521/g.16305  ORF Transcript_8521/g.16305 Transcript_8521/m.16305 type:complete len:360 (-) Transcript_8521:1183-2262(-)